MSGRTLHGLKEPVFDVLPETILANFQSPRSENALVWNLIYPLARPTISFRQLMQIRPLWGTISLPDLDDALRPYYWGFDVSGKRLPDLNAVLDELDGEGRQTEVDLFLVGQTTLIVIEAKHMSALGRCSRYAHGRCPEVHRQASVRENVCRYWALPQALFSTELDFGGRPQPEGESPACDQHYQLARTVMVGRRLSQKMGKVLYLWMMVPRKHWPSLERRWLDFADRIRDDELWRRMRILAWEDVDRLDDERK